MHKYDELIQANVANVCKGISQVKMTDSMRSINESLVLFKECVGNSNDEINLIISEMNNNLLKIQSFNIETIVEGLTKTNESLVLENSVLQAKLNVTESVPIVYQGYEEDFYPDEIKDMVLGALEEVLANTEQTTRRADILEDILENNLYQHLSEKRKQKVKAIFKGYKNLSSAMKQELMDLGMVISDDGKHYKMTYKDDARYMVTIGKTPSDSRAGNNNAALINKIMM